MDWSLHDTSVVIVGAGFSVAATKGALPLMGTFFDRLERSDYQALYDFVTEQAGPVATANVEMILLVLDQIRTSPEAVLTGWAEHWKSQISVIYDQLSLYTLKRLDGCKQIPQDSWAADILADSGPDTTVISMNYDNVAEIVLSNRKGMHHGTYGPTCPHCKMRRLMELACSCEGRQSIDDADWRGTLIKPHGSIAWKRCLNPACCSYQCLVGHPHCKPFEPCACPTCEYDCGHVMVMPTMSKNLEDIPEIGVMWQAARHAIEDAESILLFGFSMPSSDELLTQMMRCAIQKKRKLQRVAVIDLDPAAVLGRFERCVPIDMEVEATQFRVIPGQVPTWYYSRADGFEKVNSSFWFQIDSNTGIN